MFSTTRPSENFENFLPSMERVLFNLTSTLPRQCVHVAMTVASLDVDLATSRWNLTNDSPVIAIALSSLSVGKQSC